jgi:hypothetical protein
MPNHYDENCTKCEKTITSYEMKAILNGEIVCVDCYLEDKRLKEETGYNEPEHYHKHAIDTIKFLQEGFPKEVCMGFFLGNVIKYTQRANYKNGREDYVKMVDYAKRALDWYDKTHS